MLSTGGLHVINTRGAIRNEFPRNKRLYLSGFACTIKKTEDAKKFRGTFGPQFAS
jgi:hypothetical protein